MQDSFEFTAALERFTDSPLWQFHIMVPGDIASRLIEGKDTRVLAQLDGVKTIHCALMPDGNGGRFIMINKEIRKELQLDAGRPVLVQLQKDDSKYGMAMPEEFQELLALDVEGSDVFHSLTMGKQRNLIHIVGKPKQSQTRINKALVVLEYLKQVNGKLDFKELNQAFKNANNR